MTESVSAPVRLVCFDLGGVVIRICRSWAEGCDAVGLDVRGDVDSMLRTSTAWKEMNEAYQRGAIPESEFAERFCANIDGLYSTDELVRVHRAWTRGVYPRIEDVIGRIHDRGIETAVLSNTCHEHWERLVGLRPLKEMKHLFASHLLAACKPHADAYRAVEAGTGHAGDSVLFFDDLPENVAGARAIGWRAECVDPGGCTATQIESGLTKHGIC